MKFTYKHTLIACYIGYIAQAIVNNLAPLLYVTFSKQFGISLSQISLLITVNFALQILIDLASTFFVDRIGYRRSVILAELLATIGLCGLSLLPMLMPNKFVALLIATCFSAVGGGLIEVVVSPLVEAIPGEKKASVMGLLHSFYCWGQVGVVLLSTLYFLLVGIENWQYLPLIWAAVPLVGAVLYSVVPIAMLNETEEKKSSPLSLLRQRMFWLLVVLMLAAGASELAIAQWASLFAEQGLGVSKTLGDLLGPCAFAVLMGLGRVLYSRFGAQGRLELYLTGSFLLCVASYLLIVFAPTPVLSLVGCAIAGFSVAVMWPGTYSLGAERMPRGGTAMFALFALAGDVGCTAGPDLVGLVSDAVEAGRLSFLSGLLGQDASTGLKAGILLTAIFPLVAFFCSLGLLLARRRRQRQRTEL